MPPEPKAPNPEENACPNCGEALFDDCLDCGKRLDLVGAQFCPFCAHALYEPEGQDVLLEPWRQLGAKATLLIGAQRWHALAAAFAVATTIGIALGTLILGILRADSTWLQSVYFVLILLVLAAALSVSSLLETGIEWPVRFQEVEATDATPDVDDAPPSGRVPAEENPATQAGS